MFFRLDVSVINLTLDEGIQFDLGNYVDGNKCGVSALCISFGPEHNTKSVASISGRTRNGLNAQNEPPGRVGVLNFHACLMLIE